MHPVNPYINYPFIEFKKWKEYIDEAHHKGLKVKIYNTIRELVIKRINPCFTQPGAWDIFGRKGLDSSWLQEHLGDDYIAAWFVRVKDTL